MNTIEKILTYLFPVKMPHIDLIYVQGGQQEAIEDGIGMVKTKPYRDAIDRHWQTARERAEFSWHKIGKPKKTKHLKNN